MIRMEWDLISPSIYTKWKHYWFETHPTEIAEYSWNYLFTGGKQIRPKLFCELLKHLSPNHMKQPYGELAFAIECIHVASLILDDMPYMDNASERRGKQTLHSVFSERKAILLFHDVLYMAYLIWTTMKPSHMEAYDWEKFIIEKLLYLVLGQWYDLQKKGTLLELASLKTGMLFELVTETVALLIGLDRPFWRSWGNHLGILFQWMDDLHDCEEDKKQGNRNAFNESYDDTMESYIRIWKQIETGIGREWFTTPFGGWMKSYFTNGIDLPPPQFDTLNIDIPYPITIVFPTFSLPSFVVQLIGSQYVKRVYNIMQYASKNIEKYTDYIEKYRKKYMNRYNAIKHILWQIDEKTWEHQPQLIRLLTDVYQDTRRDMKDMVRK